MISYTEKFGPKFYNHEAQKATIGPSSLKILDGEDLNYGNRKRLNQMQQKRWLDQQVEEKQAMNAMKKNEKNMYDTMQKDVNDKWGELNDEHEKRRRDMRVACRDTLDGQIREKFERDALDKLLSDQQSQQHIDTCLNDDFYLENTDTCKSNVSDTRVLKYHWKGMNNDQKKQILLEQERMRADNKAKKDLEVMEEKAWALQEEKIRRDLIKMQRENERQSKACQNDQDEYNKFKAKEDTQRSKIMYDDVHRYK